jgi:hypothetical protein
MEVFFPLRKRHASMSSAERSLAANTLLCLAIGSGTGFHQASRACQAIMVFVHP